MTHHPLAYSDAEIHSLARFQTLQAGQYWRALENVPEEGIDAGMVLLIQSLRVVDDKPHTVVLRPHPLKFGQSVYLEIPKEGGGMARAARHLHRTDGRGHLRPRPCGLATFTRGHEKRGLRA